MPFAPVPAARTLMRTARTATLATLDAATGAPFASLVAVATAPDGAPLLLLSTLALHTRNLAADPRASLLLDDRSTETVVDDPLAGSRVTVVGRIDRLQDGAEIAEARRRFLSRHGEATGYADFADFSFYRMGVASAHLVAGFGRIHTMPGSDLVRPASDFRALTAAEPNVLAELNADHAAAIRRLAATLGRPDGEWRVIGADPYGLDLECLRAGRVLDCRYEFAAPATTPADIRSVVMSVHSSD